MVEMRVFDGVRLGWGGMKIADQRRRVDKPRVARPTFQRRERTSCRAEIRKPELRDEWPN